eukprot:gene15824-17420_t
MDCTRPSVFPYDNNEGFYGEFPSKYPSYPGSNTSHFRNLPYASVKNFGTTSHFPKTSLTGDQPASTGDTNNFAFGGHNEPASEKCQFSGTDHYLHMNGGDGFPGHDAHSYMRAPPISQEPRTFIQGSTDLYQHSNNIDSFGSLINGTLDHYPHPFRASSTSVYPPDVKFNPDALSGQIVHEYSKFGPYAQNHSSMHSHRYGSVNEYSPNSFYAGSDSGLSSSQTNNVMNSNMPGGGGVVSSNSILMPTKLASNILSRNAITPTGPFARDSDVEQVDETHKCKNTIEGTKTSVRRFKKWYREKYVKSIDMNTINKFNAPELLKDFFLEIRDTRPGRVGNEYEPVTLTTYRNGLRRYFLYRKVPPAPDNFDLTDKSFDIVNKRLMTKRDDLKRKGKGNHPNAVESITAEQLDKMWASGAIGIHAPRPLLRLQWWLNTVFHGIRGRMAHHDLSIDDFRLARGPDGKLCVEYVKVSDRINASKIEPAKGKRRGKGRVFESDGSERDPVRAFETYKAHRPPSISSFYLTPKQKPKGSVWFNKVPMGKNSIGRIMREIKAIAGIN